MSDALVDPLDVIVQARLALTPQAFDWLMRETQGKPTIGDVLVAMEGDGNTATVETSKC